MRHAPPSLVLLYTENMRITSASSQKVKFVRSLGRRRTRHQEGCFVVEGRRLVEDALRAGIPLRMAFYTDDFAESPAGAEVVARLGDATAKTFPVSSAVMQALSDTVTPQGVLAVAEMPQWPQPQPPAHIGLVLDQWRDPGNLGAALRSAEAAGVDWVALTPGSVDPFNPKVVRGGMGVHFRLPIFVDWDLREMPSLLEGVSVYLADARAALSYDEVDWTQPSVLLVGGEAHGPGEAAHQLDAVRIAIPMEGSPDSLNAAMATSVILMEAARQRRQRGA